MADALSRMFDGNSPETPEVMCANLLNSLPLVFSSLEEHQKGDAFCENLRGKIQGKGAEAKVFHVHKGFICYFPRRAKRRRWVLPPPPFTADVA